MNTITLYYKDGTELTYNRVFAEGNPDLLKKKGLSKTKPRKKAKPRKK